VFVVDGQQAGAGLAGEPDLTSLADVANAIINAK
jgi:hypothetical protein